MAESSSERRRDARLTAEITDIPLRFPATRLVAVLFGRVGAARALGGIGDQIARRRRRRWGNDIPVNWGLAIVNYVWFLGIGHAGTLISAPLLILDKNWRNSAQPLRRGDDPVR